MENIEYANAYSEVLEIIKYISKEDYNKIPKSKIELFEKKANPNYKLAYNPSLTLEQQQVSKRAKAIIAILFRDYWATDEQRENIIRKQRDELYKLEQEKYEKYKPEDLFKNRALNTMEANTKATEDTTALIKHKESFISKIINKIKRLFKGF